MIEGGWRTYIDNVQIFAFPALTNTLDVQKAVPISFHLFQNYPNQFNTKTVISDVELVIYNQIGQKVATLVSENQNLVYHQVEWDARRFSSGIYYYQIQADNFTQVSKLVYLK